jgi:hypothetical protein
LERAALHPPALLMVFERGAAARVESSFERGATVTLSNCSIRRV